MPHCCGSLPLHWRQASVMVYQISKTSPFDQQLIRVNKKWKPKLAITDALETESTTQIDLTPTPSTKEVSNVESVSLSWLRHARTFLQGSRGLKTSTIQPWRKSSRKLWQMLRRYIIMYSPYNPVQFYTQSHSMQQPTNVGGCSKFAFSRDKKLSTY